MAASSIPIEERDVAVGHLRSKQIIRFRTIVDYSDRDDRASINAIRESEIFHLRRIISFIGTSEIAK